MPVNEQEALQRFAATLREGRRRKGWTQGQLAQRLGVGTNAVSAWENGQRWPRELEQYVKLIEELEVPLPLPGQELAMVPRSHPAMAYGVGAADAVSAEAIRYVARRLRALAEELEREYGLDAVRNTGEGTLAPRGET